MIVKYFLEQFDCMFFFALGFGVDEDLYIHTFGSIVTINNSKKLRFKMIRFRQCIKQGIPWQKWRKPIGVHPGNSRFFWCQPGAIPW